MKCARGSLSTVVFLIVCLTFCYHTAGQTKRPNIVVIVADDMGYADIGVHGSKDIPTPHIDSLAKDGIRFTDAYVTGPYCSPTRAGLLTGRYPQRFGHEYNIGLMRPEHRDVGLPLSEKTLADMLRAAGYRTALVGKWHLGSAPRFHPNERGFDEFFGFLGGSHAYVHPQPEGNPIFDGRTIVREIPYLTDAFSARAASFIDRQKSSPFFLYLAFNAVHTPLQTTEKYLARFPSIKDPMRQKYAAMLSAMDDAIGQTLAALKAAGIEDNTLVLFFSDNGGPTIYGGLNGSSNAPLRGSKATTFEGGIRVPFILKWKKAGLGAGSTYSHPIIQLDVLPTVLAAAGVKPTKELDGVNLFPFLTRGSKKKPHDALYWRTGGAMAIRKGDWKLVRSPGRAVGDDPSILDPLTGTELYNLKEDIGETTDVALKNPDKAKELAEAWRQWAETLSKPGWPPVPPAQERPAQ